MASLQLQAKSSLRGVAIVLQKPLYLLLAIISTFIGLGIILWSLNYTVLGFVLYNSSINFFAKFDILFGIYEGMFSLISNTQSTILLLFSVLFGMNIALLVYVVLNRVLNHSATAKTSGSITMAVVAGGCAACGASLLSPLLATVGVTSLLAAQRAGIAVGVIGIGLTLWAILQLGQIVSSVNIRTGK